MAQTYYQHEFLTALTPAMLAQGYTEADVAAYQQDAEFTALLLTIADAAETTQEPATAAVTALMTRPQTDRFWQTVDRTIAEQATDRPLPALMAATPLLSQPGLIIDDLMAVILPAVTAQTGSVIWQLRLIQRYFDQLPPTVTYELGELAFIAMSLLPKVQSVIITGQAGAWRLTPHTIWDAAAVDERPYAQLSPLRQAYWDYRLQVVASSTPQERDRVMAAATAETAQETVATPAAQRVDFGPGFDDPTAYAAELHRQSTLQLTDVAGLVPLMVKASKEKVTLARIQALVEDVPTLINAATQLRETQERLVTDFFTDKSVAKKLNSSTRPFYASAVLCMALTGLSTVKTVTLTTTANGRVTGWDTWGPSEQAPVYQSPYPHLSAFLQTYYQFMLGYTKGVHRTLYQQLLTEAAAADQAAQA